ncbi:hypothetical protein ACFL1M_00045 [Patescibacteria group bacterium]
MKIENKKKNKENFSAEDIKQYWVPIVSGLFILLSLFLVLIPSFSEISKTRFENKRIEKSLNDLNKKYSILDSLTESSLNGQVSLVEGALPSEKPVFNIINMIQAGAGTLGVVVDSFEFSPGSLATESAQLKNKSRKSSGVGDVEFINAEISVVGTFDQVLAFVDLIENSLPVTEVDSVSVSSGNIEFGELKSNLLLKVYYSLPPTSIGKVSSPISELTDEQGSVIEEIKKYSLFASTGDQVTQQNSERFSPFSY